MSRDTHVGPLPVSAACSLCLPVESAQMGHQESRAVLWCFAHASPGRNEWQDSAPSARRANFDGGAGRDSLPLKKARAGQRGWAGPTYLSRDTVG